MTVPALTVAARLEAIAAHLLAVDGPHGDWFAEAIALMRNGTPFDQAVGWAGYETPLKRQAQTAAIRGMLDALPPGASALPAQIWRQLAVARPEGHAAAYLKAGGRVSERTIRRRVAELAPANVIWALWHQKARPAHRVCGLRL